MKIRIRRRAALRAAAWCTCAIATLASAAPGDLDPGYGQGGMATLRLPDNPSLPNDAVLQNDGKLLVAAALNNTPRATQAFGVIRVTATGQLDGGFGRNGVASANFTNFINTPSAMALLPDGRIVVAGTATSSDGTLNEFAVARFTPRGLLDRTFGSGGKVTTSFVGVRPGGASNPATALLALPGGKLLVAGAASPCADCVKLTALARYDADGSLDATFGSGGMASVDAIGAPHALALLSNGDVLALAGTELAEFTPDGNLTTVTSTTGGATIAARASTGHATFAPNGQFLFAGTAQGPLGPHDIDIQVERFNPLGNLDVPFQRTIFDFAGAATAATQEAAQAITIQGNGQILVGGISAPTAFDTDFGIARLNGDGTLDAGFGHGGTITTVFANRPGLTFSFVSALAVQVDAKVIAIGLAGNQNGNTFLALARYLGL
ncbi:MAG: hypothetical protein JSR59_05045 [Proteobacteria bacterium]|nr:hypothetical protein [Pseudomonadota bacterium]